ncbi:hypothetical protein FACS1894216_12030 [Synergistales bacterium]|nr:hypothetical protein FACS1894216_12030 [Synergistales bacterium]
MRIYLDNCCYNRPFDDQENVIVRLETRAKLTIQSLIKFGALDLVSSFMLLFEISAIETEYIKSNILNFVSANAKVYVAKDKLENIMPIAEQIMLTGVKQSDAIHVACAVVASCAYFISTDKRLLKYKSDSIKLIDPIDFIRLEEGKI